MNSAFGIDHGEVSKAFRPKGKVIPHSPDPLEAAFRRSGSKSKTAVREPAQPPMQGRIPGRGKKKTSPPSRPPISGFASGRTGAWG